MVADPNLGVVPRVVDFDGLALIAQVDRALVPHVVQRAAVPHDLDVVRVPDHVQRSLVRLDQDPVLVADNLQVVPVVLDPDALLVPKHVLGLPYWHDHFSSEHDDDPTCYAFRLRLMSGLAPTLDIYNRELCAFLAAKGRRRWYGDLPWLRRAASILELNPAA